ncbi:hypothetical protein AgCh_027042 [Apium graveolens]
MEFISELKKHIDVIQEKISFFLCRKRWRRKRLESWRDLAEKRKEIRPYRKKPAAPKSIRDHFFHRLFFEVNRLLTYPNWLPVQRNQISFFVKRLKYLSETSRWYRLTDEDSVSELLADRTLHVLVTTILKYKNVRTSVGLLNFADPPDLGRVGNRLAVEVFVFFKASKFMFDFRNKWIHGYKEEEFVRCFNFDDPLDLELPAFKADYCMIIEEAGQEEYFAQDFSSQIFDSNKFQQGEVVVGFQEEASSLLQQLASITRKKLEVISIVGMAGLGKTTLARKLYNDPYVVSYFYTRAWVTCSQVYSKRDLLISILRSVTEITDEVFQMNDDLLAHALYRALKVRRYLIVIDDIWSINAWNDFKRCFPDDNNGSRIMLTTRLKEVALYAQSDGNPLCLRFLTEEESFDLFKRKLLRDGNFFGTLSSLGKSITKKCHGLPLAIVVIAGLLKNNFEIEWWAQIEEHVSSYILSDYNQYMNTLALSYDHLPQHLRPCFLSFGAFPEDYDIPVSKLIWLWIAEGFISQDGANRSLEDIAEDYLMDLINRSLVIVGKKGSGNAIKTCHIHDLLRDLCLRKAEEEYFSPDLYRHNKHSFSCPHSLVNPTLKCQLLLSTNVLTIPSNCSCYTSELSQSMFKHVSVLWDTSKQIRSLDLSSIELLVFPTELLQLVHLRYLEIRFRSGNPPESISQLRELQTLIMTSRMDMVVPGKMWKLINLKHLRIKSGENLLDSSTLEDESTLVDNLRCMSLISPTRPCKNILARAPNLQKLGLCGPLTTTTGDLKCPDLGHLMQLETLKLLNTVPYREGVRLSISTIFPGSLKNLTLSNTCLDWEDAWIFEMIPNLKCLKLKFHAFVGKDWKTTPEAFPSLEFLKIDELDLVTWTASRMHFSVLQNLQVYRCPYLMEIPEDFGNICTLEWLEISGCSDSATNSAKDMQKEQESIGNDSLKILLNPGLTKPMHDRAER